MILSVRSVTEMRGCAHGPKQGQTATVVDALQDFSLAPRHFFSLFHPQKVSRGYCQS